MIKNSKPNDCFCIIYANIVTSIFSIIIIRCFFPDTESDRQNFVFIFYAWRKARKIILKEIICPRKISAFPSPLLFPEALEQNFSFLKWCWWKLKARAKICAAQKMEKLVMLIAIINFIFQFTMVMLNFQVEIN